MKVPPIRYAAASDGASIAFAVLGSGRPLFILPNIATPGIDQTLATPVYRQSLDRLAANRAVVLFDWRGLGLSTDSNPEYSAEKFVNDIEAVVAALDAKSVDLFARAGIAHVALTYAADNDGVRSVMLENPQPRGMGQRPLVFASIEHLQDED